MPFTPYGTPIGLVATTGVAGFALQNATPNILSWTPPNDGNMHRVIVITNGLVSSAETGGQINLNFTDPGGNVRGRQVYAGGLAAGILVPALTQFLVQAGQAVTLVQQTALTLGAAEIWAELWGS